MAISVDSFLGPLLPDGLRRCRNLVLYPIARSGAMPAVRFGPLLSRWSGDKPHIFQENGNRGRLGPILLRSAPIGPCLPSDHSSVNQASPKPIGAAKFGLERLSASTSSFLRIKGANFHLSSRASISLTSLTRSFKDSPARSALKLARKPIPPPPKSHRRTLVPYLII